MRRPVLAATLAAVVVLGVVVVRRHRHGGEPAAVSVVADVPGAAPGVHSFHVSAGSYRPALGLVTAPQAAPLPTPAKVHPHTPPAQVPPATLAPGGLFTTYNVGGKNSDAQVLADVLHLLAASRVVALQEVGDRKAVLSELRRRGFGVYTGNGGPGADRQAVVWRADLLRVRKVESIKTGDRTHVGEAGAGGPDQRATWINAVTLENRTTGRVVGTFGSTHVAASVYLSVRAKLAREHVKRAAAWLERESRNGAVYLGGDFNMPWTHRLMAPLRKVGRTLGGGLPTHDKREIDHIIGAGNVRDVTGSTWSGTSDHRAKIIRRRRA